MEATAYCISSCILDSNDLWINPSSISLCIKSSSDINSSNCFKCSASYTLTGYGLIWQGSTFGT